MYVVLIIAGVLLLTACGGKQSKADVIQQIEEHMDDVETYYTEATIDIALKDTNETLIDHSKTALKVYMNETTMDIRGESVENDVTTQFYATEAGSYVQVNDAPWAIQEEKAHHAETSYPNVAQIIIDLKDEEKLEMEEQDGKYVFTFTGKSETVYEAFEQPYSLTLTGAKPKNVQQDVTITIDSESYFIDHVMNTLLIEADGQRLEMMIDQTYDNVNNIDEIEIPQEVIEEAQSENETVSMHKDKDVVTALSHIEEKVADVKSYSTEMGIYITITDVSTNQTLDTSEETSYSHVIEDPFQLAETLDSNGEQSEYYTSEEATYIKLPDEAWQDITDPDESPISSKALYTHIANILLTVGVADGVAMEDEDGMLLFTFTGKNEAIYDTFKRPYNLSLTGVEPKDMVHDIHIIVDPQTHFITHVENIMRAQVNGQEMKLHLVRTYENMNELEEINIPQEVIDEAS